MNLEKTVIESVELAKRVEKVRNRDPEIVSTRNGDVWMHSFGFGSSERAKKLVDELNERIAVYNAEYLAELEQKFALKFAGAKNE